LLGATYAVFVKTFVVIKLLAKLIAATVSLCCPATLDVAPSQ